MIKKFLPLFGLIVVIGVFFWQFLFKGLLPIPADTIIGLYHPYRDLYSKDYPRGIPFKNFLITDPVRQIYPWKELSIDLLNNYKLPSWDPYEMAGKPLAGNFQSSPYYPLNIILFMKPFFLSWSIFIIAQLILSSLFMFAYLDNLKLEKKASFLGALSFTLSGFSIAWLEWGTVFHAALWLPLILLAIDKLINPHKSNFQFKYNQIWTFIFIFSLISSFLAGHLQTFFYLFVFSFAYLVFRWFEFGKRLNTLILFAICYLTFAIITSIQWIPTIQFINLSARGLDLNWTNPGWFIPWQNLIQYIIPDFFGNPTTLNYFGVWNYAEFVGYIGIIPLLFAFYGVFRARIKKVYFFVGGLVIALLFALPNPVSQIPFKLGIPLLSSSQPTRLIFIASFSLAVLGAIGFDRFLKNKEKGLKQLVPIALLFLLFALTWITNYKSINLFNISAENLLVVNRNLIFPTFILLTGSILILVNVIVKNEIVKKSTIFLLLVILALDLLRFSDKFSSFSKKEYLFPGTKTVEFVKKDGEIFRVASNDLRIFPPNFLTHYKIQSIEGYDPLYLLSYAQLIAASERGEPNINPPYGFNRIITPHRLDSPIIDLLNVKYVFSLSDLNTAGFIKVFEEGQTKVYENREVLPRAFFVEELKFAKDKQEAISIMFGPVFDPRRTAVVEEKFETGNFQKGTAEIVKYSENEIVVESNNSKEGFLVLTDSFYPTWHAKINNERTKIYKTDFNFRGIFVPSGRQRIVFNNFLF